MSVVKELAASVKAGNLITVCSIGIDEYENVTNEIANALLKDEMGGAYITDSVSYTQLTLPTIYSV